MDKKTNAALTLLVHELGSVAGKAVDDKKVAELKIRLSELTNRLLVRKSERLARDLVMTFVAGIDEGCAGCLQV